jgi:hypothetical protein
MRIAATTTAVATARQADVPDPIEWLFYEHRGPATAHAGRYGQTTIELWAANEGQARLTDGRMSYAHDPGTVERWYQSVPWLVRDGVEPDGAMEDARRGAVELVAALQDALPGLERYRVVKGSRPARDPDQLDLWVRRASGLSERYLVPIDAAGNPLAATVQAATRFASTIRARFAELDPADLDQR